MSGSPTAFAHCQPHAGGLVDSVNIDWQSVSSSWNAVFPPLPGNATGKCLPGGPAQTPLPQTGVLLFTYFLQYVLLHLLLFYFLLSVVALAVSGSFPPPP